MDEHHDNYEEFQLRISRREGHSYAVLASTSDGRTARGTFDMPVTDTELDEFLAHVPLSIGGESAVDDELASIQAFGGKLFDAVFKDDVDDIYNKACGAAEDDEHLTGVRLTLVLTDAPELMRVPWEFLFSDPKFLSQSGKTPVVRSLDCPTVRKPLRVAFPIKVLGIVSSPGGYPELDVDTEKQRLEQALGELCRRGLVSLEWLPKATLGELTKRISQRDDVHIIHFIGHGAYSELTQGRLVLEHRDGAPHEVTGRDLGTSLQDEKKLRLVVLNSCEGARTSLSDAFAGVAAGLLEFDIPAVVGMQFVISDGAAIAFSESLYSALADGQPVDAAMGPARRAIVAESDVEFGTPVLFLRASDARLFDLVEPWWKRIPALPQRTRSIVTKAAAAMLVIALVATVALIAATGFGRNTVAGTALSAYADPFKVGGLAAEDGPRGRLDAPEAPTVEIDGTDGGDIDMVAAWAVSDLEEYWSTAYDAFTQDSFVPPTAYESFDSTRADGGEVCAEPTTGLENAFYCPSEDALAWDRGALMPKLHGMIGDMGVVLTLAHEFGHLIQTRIGRVEQSVLASEQQADCYAGSFMHWVAEGRSHRFALSTGDGLNEVLTMLIGLRSPAEDDTSHGSAFDRIYAFQSGFTEGVDACNSIDDAEIAQRRVDFDAPAQSTASANRELFDAVFKALKRIHPEVGNLRLEFTASAASRCPGAPASYYAWYCESGGQRWLLVNSVQIALVSKLSSQPFDLATGIHTAITMIASRFMLAVQDAHPDVVLDNDSAALRTACLTGVALTDLKYQKVNKTQPFGLTVESLDQAVSEMLTINLTASNSKGTSVPAGFARINAFSVGVLSQDDAKCFAEYP